MGLRPIPSRWFEVLIPRDGLTGVVEALARTGAVQLEVTADVPARILGDAMRRDLAACERLARRFDRYWPRTLESHGLTGSPADVLGWVHATISGWAERAEPSVVVLEQLEQERTDLELVAELVEAWPPSLPELPAMSRAGPVLRTCAWVLTRTGPPVASPAATVVHRIATAAHEFVVAVGPPGALARVEEALEPARPRVLDLHVGLLELGADPRDRISARQVAIDEQLTEARARLQAIGDLCRLDEAVAQLARIRWFLACVPPLPDTRHFASITGWTRDPTGSMLQRALDGAGFPALLDFPAPPAGHEPPIVLHNPPWGRPFELFVRLLGIPSRAEVDPSVLLAVIVPLLFGFMFGDVGQGAIVLALGLGLWRRSAATRVLVPAGIAAMIFGVLFGSVFTSEHVLEPLWLHPLSRPVFVLGVSVTMGAAVLLLGLLLQGVGAWWNGRGASWLRTDAALVVIWLGVLGMVIDLRAGWLALVGLGWALAGRARGTPTQPGAGLGALGLLVERIVQLLVNTVSFARVGAFCLAHAGLSTAIYALAMAADDAVATPVILIVGNALAIALEGLAVSIQTTRLVLFEFFVRFLRAEGRAFRALPPPPITLGRARQGAAA